MNRTERILRYLDGKMSEHELREFREQLKKDPVLLEELDIHRLAQDSIVANEQDVFRVKLEETYKKFSKEREKVFFKVSSERLKILYRILLPIAAIIVLVLILLLPRKETPEELYANNYITFCENYSTRSSDNTYNSSKLIDGLELYFTEQYSQSIAMLEDYISINNSNLSTAHFYLALSAMEEKQMEKAVIHFQFVLDQDFSYFQEHCEWYQALAYISMGKMELAEENLLNLKIKDSFYAQKSTKILKKFH